MRTLSVILFSVILGFGFVDHAGACTGSELQIRLLTLTGSGLVTRTEYVSNGATPPVYVPVIRDSITLTESDEVTLNASPTMLDALHVAKISLVSQEKDSQGIFSTTYRVIEEETTRFGGKMGKTTRNAYLATVKTNYMGEGGYARGCGGYTKAPLTLDEGSSTR